MPSFFDLASIETIEVLQRTAYDRTCAVLGITTVQSPTTGEWTSTFAAKTGSLPCSVNPRSAAEKLRAGHVTTEEIALVKLDYLTDEDEEGLILPTDRIALSTGEVYEVVDPENVQMADRWYHVLTTREL